MNGHLLFSLLLICVAAITAGFEFRRKNRRNLALRLFSVLLLPISLYFIVYPIYWEMAAKTLDRGAVLLTEGYHPDSLRKLGDIPVFSLVPLRKKHSRTEFVPELETFLAQNPQIPQLYILGNGLKEQQLKMLEGRNIRYIPGELPRGVQTIQWTADLYQGNPFSIAGTYHNPGRRPVKLALEVFGRIADSVILNPGGKLSFNLKTIPKHTGQAVFHLISTSGSDTLANDPIPVNVKAAQKLKILLLSSSPGAEFRFLKEWLLKNGHETNIRTRISRNKFSTDRGSGLRSANLSTINAGVLNGLDLVIADPLELASLERSEKQNILTAISGGLGLISHGNTPPSDLLLLKERFDWRVFQPANLRLQFGLGTLVFNKELSVDDPAHQIMASGTARALITDQAGRNLAMTRMMGAGRLTLNLINETFPWALSGSQDYYSHFWTELIDQTSRSAKENYSVIVAEQFPQVREQNSLLIRSPDKPSPYFVGGTLAVQQDILFSSRWRADYWGDVPGWNDIKFRTASNAGQTNPSISSSAYLFSKNNWQAAKAYKLITMNRNYAQEQAFSPSTAESQVIFQRKSLPVIYFLLIFIICCGVLWLEPKLS